MGKELLPIDLGIAGNGFIHHNVSVPYLVEEALLNGEGVLSDKGALCVETGKYTGRSPKDKFIVDSPAVHDKINWGSVNVPISVEKFESIKGKMLAYLQDKDAVLVPKNYEKYCDATTAGYLDRFEGKLIECSYEMDAGSFLYLQEKTRRILEEKSIS